MKSEICYASVFLAAMAVFGFCSSASATPVPITVQFDENGNGLGIVGSSSTPIIGSLQQDPGPGGQSSVETYVLNLPGLTAGDLLLSDGGKVDDLVRFNPKGAGGNPNYLSSVLIYSSAKNGFDSVADTNKPPSFTYSNILTISEVGNGAIYTPTSGQPGFVSGITVKYAITSDVVPEPTSLYTSLGGLLLIVGVAWRKARQAAR